ncbi:MAG TPA: RluA family pseudouridine synthase [Anaerolineales bacterium]|nr:RluA family pseudouridine synthase [Anaerolineales bacterium]
MSEKLIANQLVTFWFDGPEPQRLDKYLVACLPDYSRSRLQTLIKDGLVTVEGQPARKTGQMLEGGEAVRVEIPPIQPANLKPEPISLDIIFENTDLLVVNKPAGMVVHPSAGHRSGTLVNAALAHAPEMEGVGGEHRPGVVHRLDKDTSGLILMAKNDRSHRFLQEQFRKRATQKVYLALVDGHPPTSAGIVDAPIGRDPSNRKRMAIVPEHKGRAAQTEYHTLETFPIHTLIEAHPITGRTHQIRLHLTFINCPIVGDTLYGRRNPSLPLYRQFLHATRITIPLPGETHSQTFEAPLPDDLQNILARLREM